MITRTRAAALIGLTGLTAFAAGCGTATAHLTTASAGQVRPLSLATSVTTTAGTWGVAVVGGTAADHENFCQLLFQPGASATWKLVTPPGVASNGGLLIAPLRGDSLVAGFRPSQDLTFSPLASTGDTGRSWSSAVFDAALADEPGALAGDPATGTLLALTGSGSVELRTAAGAWTVIGKRNSLTGARGSDCGLSRLTSVTLTASGTPLAAGDCARHGAAGIFAYSGGTWRSAGPAIPGPFSRDSISVLALTTVAGRTLALLQAGTGAGASVLASPGGGRGWSCSGSG